MLSHIHGRKSSCAVCLTSDLKSGTLKCKNMVLKAGLNWALVIRKIDWMECTIQLELLP